MLIIKICSTPNYWHLIFKTPFFNFRNQFRPGRKWLYPFQWLKFSLSHVRWLFLSSSSERGPVGIFKCGSRKEKYLSRECNDIIGSAKGSQISEKYGSEVGKGKRVDVYLEVRKRMGHIFFEWNKCLWLLVLLRITDSDYTVWYLQTLLTNKVQ